MGPLLDHLGEAGPSRPDDLLVELELSRKELKDLRAPLERCGAVVTRFERADDDHISTLYRWDQLVPRAEGPADLGPLVVAAVQAAVVVPEREPSRWFSWRWRWDDGLARPAGRGRRAHPAGAEVAGGPLTSRTIGVPPCHSTTETLPQPTSIRTSLSSGTPSHAASAVRSRLRG